MCGVARLVRGDITSVDPVGAARRGLARQGRFPPTLEGSGGRRLGG